MQLLTVKAVAEQLSVSAMTVYRAIDSGQLGCHRLGRAIRVSADQLNEFLAATEGER